jgi:hypothetical protein
MRTLSFKTNKMDLVDGIQNKMCEKEGRRFQFCGM